MSLENRLERLETELSADEPLLIAVVYDDQTSTEPEPLTDEQVALARELFERAREANPGQPFYTVYLNDPA